MHPIQPPLNPYAPPELPALPQPPGKGVLKSPRALAHWACWLFGAAYVGQFLIYLAESLAPLDKLNDGESVFFFSYLLTCLGTVGVFLGAVVLFLCWKYRAACNSMILDPRVMTVSPGMAVGSYFIPVLNLYLPVKAMSGIIRASFGSTPLVPIWWTLHLLSVVLTSSAIRSDSDLITRPDAEANFLLAIDFLAGIVSVILVMKITRAQCALRLKAHP
jgi:hypothetical protein